MCHTFPLAAVEERHSHPVAEEELRSSFAAGEAHCRRAFHRDWAAEVASHNLGSRRPWMAGAALHRMAVRARWDPGVVSRQDQLVVRQLKDHIVVSFPVCLHYREQVCHIKDKLLSLAEDLHHT